MDKSEVIVCEKVKESNVKKRFNNIIIEKRKTMAGNSASMTSEKYHSLVKDLLAVKNGFQKKTPREYWLLNHYDVLIVQGKEKLIVPLKENNSHVIFYVKDEELFDVLYETHVFIGHGGRDRMIKELQNRHKNITQSDIKTFLDLCEPCQQKKSEKKGLVKTMVFFRI